MSEYIWIREKIYKPSLFLVCKPK